MADHISGKDVQLRFFQNNVPRTVRSKSITVEMIGTEVADGVNGEIRDRPQTITNLFRVSLELYMPDKIILDGWLETIANYDLGLPDLNRVIGVKFKLLDGSSAAYKMYGSMTQDPWSLNVSGRTDRVMQSAKYRAQFFDSVQSAGV